MEGYYKTLWEVEIWEPQEAAPFSICGSRAQKRNSAIFSQDYRLSSSRPVTYLCSTMVTRV
jgi:hypothetical protein